MSDPRLPKMYRFNLAISSLLIRIASWVKIGIKITFWG